MEEEAVRLLTAFEVDEVEPLLVVWEVADVNETLEGADEAEGDVDGNKVEECHDRGSNADRTFNLYPGHLFHRLLHPLSPILLPCWLMQIQKTCYVVELSMTVVRSNRRHHRRLLPILLYHPRM